MPDQDALIASIARTAEAWQDPEHEPRASAAEQALAAGSPYTEEGLAYAINFRMHQLTQEALHAWLRGRRAPLARRIGVVSTEAEPLTELRDCLAVLLTGHSYVAALPESVSSLLPAFLEEISDSLPLTAVSFVDPDEVHTAVDALVFRGGDEADPEALDPEGRDGGLRALVTVKGHSIAVLDGKETEEEREALAEDGLLYDGRGTRSVKLIWVPAGLSPDPYLNAMADFRGVFPAATGLAGTLRMQKAMLDAQRIPNAFGEGLEFLVSKGSPEPQRPGHIRWVEYDSLEAVTAWLAGVSARLDFVTARPALARTLADSYSAVSPLGEANRPELPWEPGGRDVVDFLSSLS